MCLFHRISVQQTATVVLIHLFRSTLFVWIRAGAIAQRSEADLDAGTTAACANKLNVSVAPSSEEAACCAGSNSLEKQERSARSLLTWIVGISLLLLNDDQELWILDEDEFLI